MSNVKITAQQISNEARKQKQDVLNRIAKLGEFMQLTPNPEKTEYESPFQYLSPKEISSENISNKAKDSLGAYKIKTQYNIEKNYSDALKDNENNKKDVQEDFEEGKEKIKNENATLVENANNKAISKGLGRSSIRETMVEDINEQSLQDYGDLANKISSKLKQIEQEEKDLINKRDIALANFEIEYAVKLQNEIDDLTKEITDYNNKVTDYNNKLKETEEKRKIAHDEKYAKDLQRNEERNQEILRFLSKYGQGSYTVYAQQQKINAINEFVNSLDKETALEVMLEDDSIKNVLGERDFNSILKSIQERTN